MRKIKALYENEMLKIFRRPVYPILIGVVLLLMVLVGALLGSIEEYAGYGEWKYSEEDYRREIRYAQNGWKSENQQIEGLLRSFTDTWNSLEGEIPDEPDENWEIPSRLLDGYTEIESHFASAQSEYRELRRLELALQYGFDTPYGNLGYRGDCADFIAEEETRVEMKTVRENMLRNTTYASVDKFLKEYGYGGNETETGMSEERRQELVKKYYEILESGDYAAYLELDNQTIRENPQYSEAEKEIRIEANALLLSANPTGDEGTREVSEISSGIRDWCDYRIAAATGMRYETPLMESEIREAEEKAEEIMLSIQKKAVGFGAAKSPDEDSYSRAILSVGITVAMIVTILVAATIISEEIQTGSIKALVISPVKRGKIFAAKLLAVLSVMLLLAMLVFLTFVAVNSVAGFGSAPVVYTAFGSAHAVPYYLYILADVLLRFLGMLPYVLLALMLSALIRNSAFSICLSLLDFLLVSNIIGLIQEIGADYAGKSIFRTVAEMFLPESNMNFTVQFFPQALGNMNNGLGMLLFGIGQSNASLPPLWFSLCYFAVLSFCLFYTAYDSFCRRDIK